MSMRSHWLNSKIHGFDLETTGVDVETDRIVTGTFLTVSADGLEGSTSWLANPGIEISEDAAKVHGITNEHAREHGRPPGEVVAEMAGLIGQAWAAGEPVVVYNAPFDLTMLDRELRRHGTPGNAALSAPFRPLVIDPLVLDKRLHKFVRGKGARRLVNTCARYGIVLSEEDAHTSEGDTLAACRLAWKMAKNPIVASLTLAQLQEAQRDWHHAQAVDFAGWLDRQGKTEDAARVRAEAGGWPLRMLAPEVQSEKVPF